MEATIIDKAIFDKPELLKMYIYLRSQARFFPADRLIEGKTVTIRPGQLTIGTRQLASIMGVSQPTAWRMLKKLEKLGDLTLKPYKEFTLITMTFWPESESPVAADGASDTADNQAQNEYPMNSQRIASELPLNTPIDSKSGRKKDKNIITDFENEFALWWDKYPNKKGAAAAKKSFLKLRKSGVELHSLWTALNNYQRETTGKDKQYIMHGSTFLGRDERWKDYLSTKQQKGASDIDEFII